MTNAAARNERAVIDVYNVMWRFSGHAWQPDPTPVPGDSVFALLPYDEGLNRYIYVDLQGNTYQQVGAVWEHLPAATLPRSSGDQAIYDPHIEHMVAVLDDGQQTARHCPTWSANLATAALPLGWPYRLDIDTQTNDVRVGSDEVGVWRLTAETWLQVAPPLTNVTNGMFAYLPNVGVAIIDVSNNAVYRGDSNGWSVVSQNGVYAGSVAQAVADDARRGRVVLFGGDRHKGRSDATWEFGRGEERIFAGHRFALQPERRTSHAMAYDSQRGVIVLFGGERDGLRLNDTWEYTGRGWNRIATTTAPSARAGHGMIYDGHRLVLFGGDNLAQFYSDIWTYQNQRRQQLVTPRSPGPRTSHAFAYDPWPTTSCCLAA